MGSVGPREVEGEEYERLRLASGIRVQPSGRRVVVLRTKPRLRAAQAPSMSQHIPQKASPEAASLVCRSDTDLIDPKLRGLIGVDVVHGRDHPDHHRVDQSNDDMMPAVGEELRHEHRPHRSVEYTVRDAIENRRVGRTK